MVFARIWIQTTTIAWFGTLACVTTGQKTNNYQTPPGCPSFAPLTGPLFSCSTYEECSPKFKESKWFTEQDQYISDDFSKMMIIKAAELSRYAYKFRDFSQNEIVYRMKNNIELIDVRMMYHKNLYTDQNKPRLTPVHPPDKSLEELYSQIYGYSSKQVLDTVFDYEDSSIGFVGVLKIKTGNKKIFRFMGVVAFRGSWTYDDIEDSMGFNKNADDAHSSYYARVYKRRFWISEQIVYLKRKYNFTDVLFTGHSMGGTEASMAPYIFRNHVSSFRPEREKQLIHRYPGRERTNHSVIKR